MNISNLFLAGLLNVVMAELQSMQNKPDWASMFGIAALVLFVIDIYNTWNK